MPRFNVEIFKRLGNESWSNRYSLFGSSLAAVLPSAGGFFTAEQSFHSEQVAFTNIRVSTATVGDTEFSNVPLNQNGLVPGSTTGGLLPLWNVVKMYANYGYNRPYYKLYRGVLGEANSESGLVASGTQTLIEDAFDTILAFDPALWVTETDVGILTVDVDQFIRHRQLHRTRRRQTTGGLVTPE